MHISWHVIIDVWQGFHTSFIGVPYLEVPPDINRWIFRCFQRLGCTNSADKADCLVVWCISVLACLENDVVWDAVKSTPVPELQVCRRPPFQWVKSAGPAFHIFHVNLCPDSATLLTENGGNWMPKNSQPKLIIHWIVVWSSLRCW